MKIIVASENQEKFEGVKNIFPNAEIIPVDANSYIGDVALNSGLVVGVLNRINLGVLRDHGFENEDWDLIIALQSGYVTDGKKNYITDVCAVMDKNGLLIANGPMFEISKIMYEAAGKGIKLDELVDGAPRSKGVTSVLEYISEGLLNRTQATMLALSEALKSNYVQSLGMHKFNFDSKIKFVNNNTKELNNRCCKEDSRLIYFTERDM